MSRNNTEQLEIYIIYESTDIVKSFIAFTQYIICTNDDIKYISVRLSVRISTSWLNGVELLTS